MPELCTFTRHAESTYNVAGLTSGDPSVAVALSARGVEQALSLAAELERLQIDVCVHTRFQRTLETARLALGEDVAGIDFVCEPLLDDIGCGEMEGRPVADDHRWRCASGRDQAPPGGESIRDAALRISGGLRRVASRPEANVAVFTHDLVVRYVLNAVAGSSDIAEPWREAPHATVFAVEPQALARAADTIAALASDAWGRAVPGPGANGG